MNKKFTIIGILLICSIIYVSLSSSSAGISGQSSAGCTCHSATASASTIVSVTGLPANYVPNQVYNLTITVTNTTIVGSPIAGAGFNMTCNIGVLDTVGGTGGREFSTVEIGHSSRKNLSAGSASWAFKWTAPATASGNLTLTYAGNAVNGNGNTGGDFWNKTTSTVSPASSPTVTASATAITCNGGTSTITATGSGGTTPYNYRLNAGTYGTTNIFAGNIAGTYTITIRDASLITATTTVNITQPTAVTLSLGNTAIACNGGNSTITATGGGGTGLKQYSIDNISYGTGNSFSRPAGTYTVWVRDANLCSTSSTLTITQPTQITISASNTPILCNGGTFTITVTGSGGTPTYQYALGATPTFGASNTFVQTAGTYTVWVKDLNNCSTSTTVTITQPTPVTINASNTAILCNGGTSTITVTGGSGVSPYQYAQGASPVFGPSNSFIQPAGTYTVWVRDANLCSTSSTVTITQPIAINVTATNTQINCNGGTANITVTATNGVAPYSYKLNNLIFTTTSTFFNLSANTYTLTVRDANLCTQSITHTITQPTVLVFNIDSMSGISCNNPGTAFVDYTALGGTSPYSYTLSPNVGTNDIVNTRWNNINAGTFTITAHDVYNCTKTSTFSISAYPAISITTSVSPNPASTADNVILQITSPTLANAFSWSNINYSSSTNTLNLTNVTSADSGTYTANVTDTNNCINSQNVYLTVNARPIIKSKVYLSGNYNTTTNLMGDGLRSTGKLDSFARVDPYRGSTYTPFYTHVNNGIDSMNTALLAATDSNAIVDWVFLELRQATDSTIVLATRAALLRRNGDIVEPKTGSTNLRFNGVSPDFYYVAVRHRNHLGVMTKIPISLAEFPVMINFTALSTQLYRKSATSNSFTYNSTQDSCTRILNGRRALYSGNASTAVGVNNKQVKYNGTNNDRISILAILAGSTTKVGYYKQDANLDGTVRYNGINNDRIIVLQNVGISTSTIVEEQLPN